MKVAYVGPFAFPESHANSLRVKGMVSAITQAGHEVVVCPGIPSSEFVVKESPSIHVDGVDEYAQQSGLFKIRGVRGMFLGDVTIDWLHSQEKIDAVILYGTHLGYLLRLQKYAAATGVKLFLDVVEWYDPRHLPGGVFGPFAAMNEWAMRRAAKRVDGLFVISSYLNKHFSESGCRTLQVPPLFSPSQTECSKSFREENGALNICYVGFPGKKEEFSILFDGLKMAQERGVRIYVHMVGMKEHEFLQNYPNVSLEQPSSNWLKFYGRITNEAAKLVIASCDFTIVVRRKMRVTQAGFPSKVPESLSLGTPVLINSFSDVEKYIGPTHAGLMIDELSPHGVFSAVAAAEELSEDELRKIKQNARAVAESSFSPESYSQRIGQFLLETSTDA